MNGKPDCKARVASRAEVAQRWKMIAACALIGGLAAFSAASLARPRYRAEATIYALPQGYALTGTLPALKLGVGVGQPVNPAAASETGTYLVNVLRSHAVADDVCRGLGLAHRRGFAPRRRVSEWALAERLRGCVTVRGSFSGLVTISAVAADPRLACDTANTYLLALDDFMSVAARDKRRFIARRLKQVQTELEALERGLQRYQAARGTYALDVEARELIQNWAHFSAESAATQVALRENAGVTQVSGSVDDLVALRSRRAGLEARAGELGQLVAQLETRLAGLPQVGLSLARLQRKVVAKQALAETLGSLLELARIAEVEEQTRYQVLDRAHPPLRPAWPRRKLSALVGAAVGLALGLVGSHLLGMRREAMNVEP